MKRTLFIVVLVCLHGSAETKAQNQPNLLLAPQPTAPGLTRYPDPNAVPPQYRTGKYIHLEAALVALMAAEQELIGANPGKKADYLPRSILGVQQAIADVETAIDFASGLPTPAISALPSLPTGLGNVTSGVTVVATTTPKVSSPNMDAAVSDLTTAQNELKQASPSDKGVFLPRAKGDVAFAMDNANAAINLANDLPATGSAMAATPVPTPVVAAAARPAVGGNQQILWGALAVVVVIIAILVEMLLRRRHGA